MNLKAYLFDDERGVSPVIGVILMVAITVILAAVIATFVMNMGPKAQKPANVQWEGSFSTPSSGGDTFTLTHTGGEAATKSEYILSIEGAKDSAGSGSSPNAPSRDYDLDKFGSGGEMTASDSVTIDKAALNSILSSSDDIDNKLVLSGATIELIWQNPNNDQTDIVETWTAD